MKYSYLHGFMGLIQAEIFLLKNLSNPSQRSIMRRCSAKVSLPGGKGLTGETIVPSNLKSIELSICLASQEDLIVQENWAAPFHSVFRKLVSKGSKNDILYGRYCAGMCTAKWGRLRDQRRELDLKGKRSKSGRDPQRESLMKVADILPNLRRMNVLHRSAIVPIG